MGWTQEQNLKKEEERVGESKEEEVENAREKAEIGTISSFFLFIYTSLLY